MQKEMFYKYNIICDSIRNKCNGTTYSITHQDITAF